MPERVAFLPAWAHAVPMDNRSEYSTAVARVVGAAMGDKGLSVIALANLTHIPRVTLSRRLAASEFSPFTTAELFAIAPHIGMTVTEISAAAERDVAA